MTVRRPPIIKLHIDNAGVIVLEEFVSQPLNPENLIQVVGLSQDHGVHISQVGDQLESG